jgi:RNA polymerase sigma-70 factor (ECF subfamily)
MAASDWDGAVFEAHRPLLFSIAYRMLGSASEAEDVVQDVWLRARQDEHSDVRSARAYLTTIVTRLSIDRLRSADRTRLQYPGPWLPEPLAEPNQESVELASSLTTAFLVLLEQLTPTERAVFLLREVFELDFDEIARSIGKSQANTRQILTRARSRLRDARPRFTASRRESEEIVRQFRHACATGNVEELMAVLHADATLVSDGGSPRRDPCSARIASRSSCSATPGSCTGRSPTSNSSRSTARPVCSCVIRLPAMEPTRSTSSVDVFGRSTSCATRTSCGGSSSTRTDHESGEAHDDVNP